MFFYYHCSAEPFPEYTGTDDPPLNPVYPLETLLLLWATLGSSVARTIGREVLDWFTDDKPDKPPPETPKPETPLEKPKDIPKHWEQKPADKGNGTKYVDPKNRGNDVRVQKGEPKSQYPHQQKDYVRWKKDGQWLDKNGNSVSGKSPEAHIPVDEFIFKPEIFK